MPLAAHGVGTARRLTWLRGIRASISDSCSWVRATSPASWTNAAMPSYVVENCGTTNPPRPSPPKTTPSCDDRLGDGGRAGGDPADVDAVEGGDLLGDAGGGDGQRHGAAHATRRRPGRGRPAGPARRRSGRPSRRRARCVRPPGRSARRTPPWTGRDQPAEPTQGLRALGRRLGRRRLVEPVVDGEDVQAEPAEQGRQHQGGGAAAGVDHDLEAAARRGPWCRRGAAARARSASMTRGGKDRSPISPGKARRNSAAREGPLELALPGLPTGRRRAGRGRRCRRSRAARASSGSRRRPRCPCDGRQPGDRHRHHLEVDDVDRARRQGRDDGALERPGGAGHVAGRGDRGALLQGAWPRRRPAGPRARG